MISKKFGIIPQLSKIFRWIVVKFLNSKLSLLTALRQSTTQQTATIIRCFDARWTLLTFSNLEIRRVTATWMKRHSRFIGITRTTLTSTFNWKTRAMQELVFHPIAWSSETWNLATSTGTPSMLPMKPQAWNTFWRNSSNVTQWLRCVAQLLMQNWFKIQKLLQKRRPKRVRGRW